MSKESSRSSEEESPESKETSEGKKAAESKTASCIKSVANIWAFLSMVPQGALGGSVLYFSLANLVADDEDTRPGLFYFVITSGLILGAILAYLIVQARVKVINTYLAQSTEEFVNKMSSCCSREEKKIESTKEKSWRICKSYILEPLNSVSAFSNCIPFGGLNELSLLTLAAPLSKSKLGGLNIIGDYVIGYAPVRAFFTFSSFGMNLMLIPSMQIFLFKKFFSWIESVWRSYRENPSIHQERKEILLTLQDYRQQIVQMIDQKQSSQKQSSALMSDFDFLGGELENIIAKLRAEKVPEGRREQLGTPFIYILITLLLWGIAMVGLWNLLYAQQLGMQLPLQFFFDEDTAENISDQYVNNGGMGLMILNMAAQFFNMIAFNALNFFNRRREINVDRYLYLLAQDNYVGRWLSKVWPARGGCVGYWLSKVCFLAAVSTLSNVGATLAALQAKGIDLKSPVGLIFFLTALLGPGIMEFFTLDFGHRRTALQALKEEASTELKGQIELIGKIDRHQEKINQLSTEDFHQLIPDIEVDLPSENAIAQCLRALSLLCTPSGSARKPLLVNTEEGEEHQNALP